jgi:hypothetical protein
VLDRLFCYGTLCRPAVIGALLGRVPDGRAARLRDHCAGQIAGRPWLGVTRAPGDATAGTLYRRLDARELRRLDRYEGFDYRRAIVPVDTPAGRRRAWVYLPRHPVTPRANPPATGGDDRAQWRRLGLPPARRTHRASKSRPR